ncbi:unnamed protein product [Caenorhabditis angaria]|uniref:Uncharacterized protein n=1 Tax=Caenorhabditis angaria TaxID=860376 RepID=A0A9P1IFF1_9PELO|nr:unnamed protein product [Caenorhabditis angaria]
MSSSSNSIQFYITEVDSRIEKKRAELEKTLQKSEIVRKNSETIAHFVGKWPNFEHRVKQFQSQIHEIDAKIAENLEILKKTWEFSKSEEIELNKLFEELEKLAEIRKSKETILLKLVEAEEKLEVDSSDDSA